MDSECVLSFDGISKSTEVAVDGGNKPYWVSNVIYPVKDGHQSVIKVTKNKIIWINGGAIIKALNCICCCLLVQSE